MGKSILLIENDHTARSMVSFALKHESFVVFDAGDWGEAFVRLDGGLRPDLVITGVNMPGLEAADLVKGIRAFSACANIPILMLANDLTPHRQMEWREAGATCWITKPFTSGQLLEMVRMMVFEVNRSRTRPQIQSSLQRHEPLTEGIHSPLKGKTRI